MGRSVNVHRGEPGARGTVAAHRGTLCSCEQCGCADNSQVLNSSPFDTMCKRKQNRRENRGDLFAASQTVPGKFQKTIFAGANMENTKNHIAAAPTRERKYYGQNRASVSPPS